MGMGSRWPLRLFVLVAALALVGAACGGGGGGLKVTEKDFSISLDSSSADTGEVKFDIHNDGPSAHEFVIFKTDLAEDQLPLDSAGTAVDEEGTGIEHIDEVEDIAPDSDKDLTVTLAAGRYVLICNVTGHYQSGMHTVLTVS
jgi:uncharacterized cupredoxin-like copper-binding protein